MHFVTITSDWNNDDFYTSAIKGSLLTSIEDVQIITISNQIKPFSVSEAAFIVRNAYHHFPPGTIHLVTVGSDPSPHQVLLAAKVDGHFFLTADNGLLSLIGNTEDFDVLTLPLKNKTQISSFPSLTIFCDTIIRMLQGTKFENLGTTTTEYVKQIPLRATLENNTITGTVIYLDSFGNAITNISRDLFERIGKDRSFEIFVQSKHYKITKLNKFYSETTAGDLLALFNSINLLEIAIRNGSAKNLLNLNTDSTIRVEFK